MILSHAHHHQQIQRGSMSTPIRALNSLFPKWLMEMLTGRHGQRQTICHDTQNYIAQSIPLGEAFCVLPQSIFVEAENSSHLRTQSISHFMRENEKLLVQRAAALWGEAKNWAFEGTVARINSALAFDPNFFSEAFFVNDSRERRLKLPPSRPDRSWFGYVSFFSSLLLPCYWFFFVLSKDRVRYRFIIKKNV